ncbi:MAG TPA: delta-60 repeat domain-containing protein, partial [Candidatus Sulfotelmatobacter sp.]|nr:delta-60 repeat domain-containing protein [Candidatus Sulfotelmatobacter sp.]
MKTNNGTGYSLMATFWFGVLAGPVLGSPGSWDQSYGPAVTGGAVNALALQPDGKLVMGGAFTAVNNSSSRYHLARLWPDGSLDSSFFNTGSGVSGTVNCLTVQTDGRIVIGGDFYTVNGTTRNRVARLNPNGTVDGSFVPTNALSGSVLALAVQSDNKVIIGGNFSGTYFPAWNARLNADGTLDSAFSSYLNGVVYAVAVQPDGKIVIGGAFTTVNGA